MIVDKNGLNLNINDYVTLSYIPEELLNNLLPEDQEQLKLLVNVPISISEIHQNDVYNLELHVKQNNNSRWFFVKSTIVEKFI